MWPQKYFNIFADISTFCNAGCPQCHRTNRNGLGKADWLPLIQWSLDEFKQAYPKSTLDLTENIQLCGTWGDPIMNKDILDICKYVIDTSSLPSIRINTNGSIRDEDFWWELGVSCGKRLNVIFGIDGKDYYQHQLYRKFTDLNKILNNMKTISMTRAKAISQTIVFEHNQDDIHEIKQMCLDHGSYLHTFIWTDRFDRGNNNEFEYYNPDGSNYILKKATKNEKQVFNNSLKIGYPGNQKEPEQGCIECKWLKKREVVVNPDGQVIPCCYLANGYFMKGPPDFNNHELMLSYKDQEKDNNVFFRPLEEILKDSKWFNEELPESWKSDKPLKQCSRWCSLEGDKFKSQIRVYA